MEKVVFKNLEKSELAKQTAIEYYNITKERFPELNDSRVTITLSMDNSPTQAGPDLFKVKFQCTSGLYKGVILERSASTLYKALSDLSESLLERLNRFSDKKRVRKIKQARKVQKSIYQFDPIKLKNIS